MVLCIVLAVGPPPMSTSCPPDVIHVMNVPRPSPFNFHQSSNFVYYCERKVKIKMGKAWNQGYSLPHPKLPHHPSLCPSFVSSQMRAVKEEIDWTVTSFLSLRSVCHFQNASLVLRLSLCTNELQAMEKRKHRIELDKSVPRCWNSRAKRAQTEQAQDKR